MLASREGQRVPNVTFRTRQNNQWVDVTTDDLFAGKTVAVFSLPGAFTPTCSSTHLPGYNELAKVFKENGVDDIICILSSLIAGNVIFNEHEIGVNKLNFTRKGAIQSWVK